MDTLTIWTWTLVAGAVVVLVVALLLILIVRAANRIDAHAKDIWLAGKNIAANTVSIWMLQDTNIVAGDILKTAGVIAGEAEAINGKLDGLGQAILKAR